MPSKVTSLMRDILIAHMDDKLVPVVMPRLMQGLDAFKAQTSWRATQALILRKCLKYERNGRFTKITDTGRETLSVILADYAEALIRAGEERLVQRTPSTSRAHLNGTRSLPFGNSTSISTVPSNLTATTSAS